MPSFFYHIKLELYPTSDPAESDTKASRDSHDDTWLPEPGASFFDDFPSHPSRPKILKKTLAPNTTQPDSTSSSTRGSRSPYGTSSPGAGLIDCGAPRAPLQEDNRKIEIISERQWKERQEQPPNPKLAIKPATAIEDWRFGRINVETVDLRASYTMTDTNEAGPSPAPALGPMFGGAGTSTKAEYRAFNTKNTELGWGVVHLYKEGEESPSLNDAEDQEEIQGTGDDDCTTLCIPAVPSYMTPGDFMCFVGEKWQDDISHCRMVMTSRMNRYLVLLKFRSSQRAKEWQREFDGKVFYMMEVSSRRLARSEIIPDTGKSEICRAVFIKSITFETPTRGSDRKHSATSPAAMMGDLRPLPPPTPSLIELPTCPVCLERMDETTGIMTIHCAHVFHCRCLQNWKGAGCPVCRFTSTTQQGQGSSESSNQNTNSQPFGSGASNLCSTCDSPDDLWICLICGVVGCGRYKGGHAKDHWKETAHSFALELETQHVWDYAGDMWVHRLIREKGDDGKVFDLPGRGNESQHHPDEDVVPRMKLESIGLEYTHLITSQLESQRAYYEDMLSKMADKASKATAAAEEAAAQASAAMEKISLLEKKYHPILDETLPQLEKDLARERNKATKSENLARNLSKSFQEEKRLNEGLMQRVAHLNSEHENMVKQVEELKTETADLKEMNRDLSMFISGQEKLKELENEGKIEEGEIEGSSASVPEKKSRRRKK